MAFDALSLSVLTVELDSLLTGGKITKLYQPEKDEIILFIYNKSTYKLLISANSNVNRIHITDMKTDNPTVAPAFCMLLRKYLTNASLLSVEQMPFERVTDFTLAGKDELGYESKMHLIFELTGKTSNIILTDGDYIILDSIKRLPQDIESKRIILAGAKYCFFPPQNKIPPFDFERVSELLKSRSLPLRQTLCENLLGVSQTTVGEILFNIDEDNRSQLNDSRVLDRLAAYKNNLKNKKPNVVFVNGSPIEVCPFDYQSKKGEKVFYDTLNRAHDNYYYFLDKARRFQDKAKSVSTAVKNAISRTEKKLGIQKQSVLEAEGRELYRIYGDLILSNIYRIKKDDENLVAENYFEENGGKIIVPLDKTVSPQQNAQIYFKKYRKLKSTAEHNEALIKENEKLLDYLNTVKQSLLFSSETEDLIQIAEELTAAGIIKEKNKKKKIAVEPAVKPLRYNVRGYTVLVGKNNVQNNYVTFKAAKANDVWLHTQKIHSSHVLIQRPDGGSIPETVILTAAEICAFYSQSRSGSKIPVDFTERRNVKKPSGSALGFVTYSEFSTLSVDPNEHRTELI